MGVHGELEAIFYLLLPEEFLARESGVLSQVNKDQDPRGEEARGGSCGG